LTHDLPFMRCADIAKVMLIADFDPVALRLGPLQIHWYALAYLVGFLGGWAYIKQLIALKQLSVTRTQLDDFLTYAIIGVLLGGRLGYVLFYSGSYYLQHPLHIFALWEGGMSFHGGALGVIAAVLLFCKRNKLDPFAFGDLIAAAAPIGLFFGRLTNFVNGELYGRITDVPWAFIFPRADQSPRHPSQLYEAGLEGLLLFTLLWWLCVRTSILKKYPGRVAALFILGYSMSRFAVEFVREPDAQLGFLYAGATMGQLLCLPMFAFGLWVFLRSSGKKG
jgi:phosphatidylglycerol---prolipoprotein diacylglyceryl transferase